MLEHSDLNNLELHVNETRTRETEVEKEYNPIDLSDLDVSSLGNNTFEQSKVLVLMTLRILFSD